MRYTNVAVVVLSTCVSSSSALRAGRFPRSTFTSHLSQHDAYVAQIIRPNQRVLMNHEDWHKRKYQPPQNDHLDSPLSTSRITISVMPIPATMTMMATPSSAGDPSPTVSDSITIISPPSDTALAMYDSQPERPTAGDWNALTDQACTSALAQANIAGNPSGMAPCYNIRTLVAENNTFEADLRIYQIGLMTGGWKGIKSSEMSVGIRFANASVKQLPPNTLRKRGSGEAGNMWAGQGAASWSGMRREGRMMKPRRIGTLHLHGTIDATSNDVLQDVVTPSIRLSAARGNGTVIVTNLPSTDAFFVIGVFAHSLADRPKLAKGTWPLDIRAVIREGNRLEKNQVLPLVVGCVCALVPAVVEGWGIWVRWRCRETWRGKMRGGEDNGVFVVNYY